MFELAYFKIIVEHFSYEDLLRSNLSSCVSTVHVSGLGNLKISI